MISNSPERTRDDGLTDDWRRNNVGPDSELVSFLEQTSVDIDGRLTRWEVNGLLTFLVVIELVVVEDGHVVALSVFKRGQAGPAGENLGARRVGQMHSLARSSVHLDKGV